MHQPVRRVLMVNRPDALDVPGGDTVQMLATKAALERLGVEVALSFDAEPDGIGNFDVLHVFNLQNPDIQLRQVLALRKAGVPIALSTIYWDHKEVDWGKQVVRGAYTRSPRERAEIFAALARRDIAVNGTHWNTPVAGSAAYVEAQREVVRNVDLLLPNSRAEARNLFESLELTPSRYQLVPNGIDVARFADPDPEPFVSRYGLRDFVLVAARWDDRKNLALLAEALAGTGLPVVFAGSRPYPDYEALVRPLLADMDATVLDHLDADLLAAAYAAARVHALPSWFETPGLSNLEAALAGCSIVVGNRAAEPEYFGPGAYYCDPANVGGIRSAVLAAWEEHASNRARRDALRERIRAEFTWEKAAEATLAGYESLGRTRGPIVPEANVRIGVPALPRATTARAKRYEATIIVPCFDRADMTRRCLEAIENHTGDVEFEIVLVDNGSTDETPELLAGLDGDVRVIRNEENLGFARACNQGAEIARGEVLVFLNNDTVPQPGWLRGLLGALETVPRVGAVGAKLLMPSGAIGHAGVVLGKDATPHHWLRADDVVECEQIERERDFQAVTAACMAVPADVFARVGGFDEGYRNGYEDVDFCLGLRRAGYRVRYTPHSVVVHEESASQGRHDHEDANLARLRERWAHRALPDLDRHEALAAGKAPTYSVVIVTYNSGVTIGPCLESVLATIGPHDEVLVVDNASQDDTVEMVGRIRDRDRRVWLWCSAENVGFSRGVNVGLRAASGEYLALLNPDALATPGWLGAMRAHFKGDPVASRVGAVGPTSNFVAGKQKVRLYIPPERLAGLSPDEIAGQLKARGGQGVETKLLIGFCILLPRIVLEEIGLLDEDLFLGMDDLDLSWRLQLAQYRLVVATDTFVAHAGQVSFRTEPQSRTRRLTREASNALARKLEAHYGRGHAPRSLDLWGMDWFDPDLDLWGPRPTVFQAAPGDWREILPAYLAAFEPADPVTLEIPAGDQDPDALAGEIAAALGCDPATVPDIEVVADGLATDRILVGPGAPDEAPHIREAGAWRLREACGYRPGPQDRGLTSIVILTRNALWCTNLCLQALVRHTREPHEIVVVDNGSTDGTPEFLREWAHDHPDVTLVFNDANAGFAAGCNQGIAAARGEHVVLLNNDVVVTDGWLSRLLRPLADPSVGIVGPRTNYVAGAQMVHHVPYGNERLEELPDFARDWARRHAGRGHPDDVAIGFCMLLRGDLVRRIGGLDPRFGTGNFEDDDLCLRSQIAGYRIWIADDCFVHHFGSQTFAAEKKVARLDYTELMARNKQIFMDKWGVWCDADGKPALTSILYQFVKTGRTFRLEDLRVELPPPSDLALWFESVQFEGLRRANLLLWPDWEGGAWLEAVRVFAAAFDPSSPVTLVLPYPPLSAIGSIREALGEGDSPDVLVVPRHCAPAELVATCQGVLLAGGSRDAEIAHLARLRGIPAIEAAAIADWFETVSRSATSLAA